MGIVTDIVLFRLNMKGEERDQAHYLVQRFAHKNLYCGYYFVEKIIIIICLYVKFSHTQKQLHNEFNICNENDVTEYMYGEVVSNLASKNGITALQMDLKIRGVTPQLLAQVLAQAREARLFILEKMNQVISKPRPELSPFAPRIFTLQIKPEKIGELIGPGGKVIQAITQATGAEIDIEEDGTVFITAENKEKADQAIKDILETVKDLSEGEIVNGTITQIKDFGAFVDLGHRKEGFNSYF